MSAPLRVACVGAGYFSQFHRGSWARIDGVEMVGVADIDLQAARTTDLPAFTTADEMLETLTPDILDIILPPSEHAKTIEMALSKGVKTIICQKPFCLSLAEAETMADRATSVQALLIVHENFRFMPWYQVIKSQLDSGAVGTVMQATFRLRPGDGQGPEAYLDRQPYFQTMKQFLVHETAVHWVDVFRYLLGAPISVYADLRRLNPAIAGEDAGHILFDHGQGVRALFDANRLADHASDNLRRTMGEALFEGTEGTLTLFGDGRVERRRFGAPQGDVILPPDSWEGFGGDCVHALQCHVIDGLRVGTAIANTAQDYCEVIRIRDAIYRSAETASKVVL